SGLLSARLDRLGPDARSLLQAAAVIGYTFSLAALSYLLDRGRRDGLDERLRVLEHERYVTPAREASGSQASFRFVHVLMRDAAYAGLPKRARADIHARFAEWLEGTTPNPPEELIGHHFEQAYRYLGELGMPDEP